MKEPGRNYSCCDRLPTSVHFLLNDKCNAKCVFCGGDYFKSTSGKSINLEKFTRIAENIHLQHFRTICLAGAGDPLLSPDFMNIVHHTNEHYPNISIMVTTNGIALSPELSAQIMASKVMMVNISINAASRQTYKRLMQVDQFDRVCANAAAFIRERDAAGKQTLLQLSCAISRINIDELPELVEVARRTGVRHINVMYCRFYPHSIRNLNIDSPEYLLHDQESLFFHQELSDRKVVEAKALADRYGIVFTHEPLFREKGQPKKCIWTETEILVGFDGEVYPCGGGEVHFKRKVESGIYDFGNALSQTIEDFWNNDAYRKLRVSCRRTGESPIIECRYCANLMRHDDIRSHIMDWEGFEEDARDSVHCSCGPSTRKPLVSVIVPTFNRPDMLADTLKSILAQTYPAIEIVVVNDAGCNVEKLVKEVAPNAVYIAHPHNRGLAAARNTGINHATGKYIAYLDDDDIFYPEHIASLVKFLENSDYRVAYSDAHRALQHKDGDRFVTVKREVLYSREFDYDAILVDNFIPVLCVMHEKECLANCGMFDESLPRHEDWDFWIRMSRHERFAHLPTVTCEFTYRPSGSGMTSETLPLFIRTYQAIYRKYSEHVSGKPMLRDRQLETLFNANFRAYQFMSQKIKPFLGEKAISDELISCLSSCGATIPQIKSAFFWQKALAMGDSQAMPLLEMALAADAENHPARIALFESYIRCGQSTKALRQMEQLVRAKPSERNFSDARNALLKSIENHATQGKETSLSSGQGHEDTGKPRLRGASAVQECSLSIIIPLFNQVCYTIQCLEALARNTRGTLSYELILVDNGSSDGTADMLKSLGSTAKIISNPHNAGFAKACNQGAQFAKGDHLVFLNNDTIPQPGWLEALVNAANQTGADICGAKLLYPDGKVQHAGIAFNEHGIGYHIFKFFAADHKAVNSMRPMRGVTGACMLISKKLFRELKGFDECFTNGFEDVDLCLRAGELNRKIMYVPESVLIHFEERSEGRKTHDEINMQLFMSRWGGRVSCDDIEYYREAGFIKQQDDKGNTVIAPAPETGGKIVSARSHGVDSDLLNRQCSAFRQDPDNRENTYELITSLEIAGFKDEAQRIKSVYLSRNPCETAVSHLQ